jgi:hypothetical protein
LWCRQRQDGRVFDRYGLWDNHVTEADVKLHRDARRPEAPTKPLLRMA